MNPIPFSIRTPIALKLTTKTPHATTALLGTVYLSLHKKIYTSHITLTQATRPTYTTSNDAIFWHN